MTVDLATQAKMTVDVNSALKDAADRLGLAGVDAPRLDAELLLAQTLGTSREDLFLTPTRGLGGEEISAFEALVSRRAGREPVARILGTREFWSMDFTLGAATLVPRPDSETLVQAALTEFTGRRNDPLRILDLGTGSGCLLLALLSELPAATGVGLDCDENTVAVAANNASHLGLGARAEFRTSDWLRALTVEDGRFDLIVSNPPYIETDAIAGLAPEVARHEPRVALDGGVDGLQAYHRIVAGASGYLARGGSIFLELGVGQAEAVSRMLKEADFAASALYEDLGGIPRVISAVSSPDSAPDFRQ